MNNLEKYHLMPATEFLSALRADFPSFSIEAPIDVYQVPDLLGIKLDETANFNDLRTAGSVSIESGDPVIWINPIENDYPPRKRFTLAHEIGHLILHMNPKAGVREFIDTKKTLNRRDSYWDKKEYEANNFAAQFLMPVSLINKHGRRIISSYKEKSGNKKMPIIIFIEEMADLFEVSESAMRFRLKNTGAIK